MSIAENLNKINLRIAEAAREAGREPTEVRLVAVSKTKPVQAVQEAMAAGQAIFGENYLQEMRDKVGQAGPGPQWHFIGHLQSKKARQAAELAHVIQSVDRLKLINIISKRAVELDKQLGVLIQVNVGGEEQKSGCSEADAPALCQAVAEAPNLKLMGLMTMPPFFDEPERVRPIFARLRELALTLAPNLPQGSMDELSMGMSGDFEAAIAEGATLVRVGTAIFGSRY